MAYGYQPYYTPYAPYQPPMPDQLAQLRQGQLPDNFIPLPQRLDDLVLKNRITQKQREAVGL